MAQALANCGGLPGGGAGQQHGKLFSAQAPRQVVRAQKIAFEHAGQVHQHHIARGVTPGVVDALEMVQVEHEDHATRPATGLARALWLQPLHEGAAVGKPCQGVGAGKALKGLLMAPAFGHIFGKPQPPQLIAVGGEDGNELDLHRAPIPQRNLVGGCHRIIVQRAVGWQNRPRLRRHQHCQFCTAVTHDIGRAQRHLEQIAQGLVHHHGSALRVLRQHACRKMPNDFQQVRACGGEGLFALAPFGGVHQGPDQVASGLLRVQQGAANREPAQSLGGGGQLVFHVHSPGATDFFHRLAKVTEGCVFTADHAHAAALEWQPIHGKIFFRTPVAQFNRVVGRGDQQRRRRVVEHGVVQKGVRAALADVGLCANDQRDGARG